MICYKDKTWCNHFKDCLNGHKCDKAYTEKVQKDAIKWWGSNNPPVMFEEYPKCFTKQGIK